MTEVAQSYAEKFMKCMEENSRKSSRKHVEI